MLLLPRELELRVEAALRFEPPKVPPLYPPPERGADPKLTLPEDGRVESLLAPPPEGRLDAPRL